MRKERWITIFGAIILISYLIYIFVQRNKEQKLEIKRLQTII